MRFIATHLLECGTERTLGREFATDETLEEKGFEFNEVTHTYAHIDIQKCVRIFGDYEHNDDSLGIGEASVNLTRVLYAQNRELENNEIGYDSFNLGAFTSYEPKNPFGSKRENELLQKSLEHQINSGTNVWSFYEISIDTGSVHYESRIDDIEFAILSQALNSLNALAKDLIKPLEEIDLVAYKKEIDSYHTIRNQCQKNYMQGNLVKKAIAQNAFEKALASYEIFENYEEDTNIAFSTALNSYRSIRKALGIADLEAELFATLKEKCDQLGFTQTRLTNGKDHEMGLVEQENGFYALQEGFSGMLAKVIQNEKNRLD